MAGDLEGVDLSGVEADTGGGGWKVKPNGWYRVMVTETEVRLNNAGTGKVMPTKFTHLDPLYHNQYEMHYFNVQHAKPKTQEIGRGQLKALAIAVGHETPDSIGDSKTLWNKPLMIQLYSKHEPGQYADSDGMVQCVGGYRSEEEHAAKEGNGAGAPPPQHADSPAHLSAPPDEIPF